MKDRLCQYGNCQNETTVVTLSVRHSGERPSFCSINHAALYLMVTGYGGTRRASVATRYTRRPTLVDQLVDVLAGSDHGPEVLMAAEKIAKLCGPAKPRAHDGSRDGAVEAARNYNRYRQAAPPPEITPEEEEVILEERGHER
jgi:hypothetical protein